MTNYYHKTCRECEGEYWSTSKNSKWCVKCGMRKNAEARLAAARRWEKKRSELREKPCEKCGRAFTGTARAQLCADCRAGARTRPVEYTQLTPPGAWYMLARVASLRCTGTIEGCNDCTVSLVCERAKLA